MNSTEAKAIRKFGIIALIFFGCLGALGFWMNKPLPSYLFGFLSILGLGFVVMPSYLRPVYAAWLKIAYLLSKIVTTLIFTLIYYLVITPSALIKRLLSGIPLPVKGDEKSSSYWVARNESAQPRERFIKRY